MGRWLQDWTVPHSRRAAQQRQVQQVRLRQSLGRQLGLVHRAAAGVVLCLVLGRVLRPTAPAVRGDLTTQHLTRLPATASVHSTAIASLISSSQRSSQHGLDAAAPGPGTP